MHPGCQDPCAHLLYTCPQDSGRPAPFGPSSPSLLSAGAPRIPPSPPASPAAFSTSLPGKGTSGSRCLDQPPAGPWRPWRCPHRLCWPGLPEQSIQSNQPLPGPPLPGVLPQSLLPGLFLPVLPASAPAAARRILSKPKSALLTKPCPAPHPPMALTSLRGKARAPHSNHEALPISQSPPPVPLTPYSPLQPHTRLLGRPQGLVTCHPSLGAHGPLISFRSLRAFTQMPPIQCSPPWPSGLKCHPQPPTRLASFFALCLLGPSCSVAFLHVCLVPLWLIFCVLWTVRATRAEIFVFSVCCHVPIAQSWRCLGHTAHV